MNRDMNSDPKHKLICLTGRCGQAYSSCTRFLTLLPRISCLSIAIVCAYCVVATSSTRTDGFYEPGARVEQYRPERYRTTKLNKYKIETCTYLYSSNCSASSPRSCNEVVAADHPHVTDYGTFQLDQCNPTFLLVPCQSTQSQPNNSSSVTITCSVEVELDDPLNYFTSGPALTSVVTRVTILLSFVRVNLSSIPDIASFTYRN